MMQTVIVNRINQCLRDMRLPNQLMKVFGTVFASQNLILLRHSDPLCQVVKGLILIFFEGLL